MAITSFLPKSSSRLAPTPIPAPQLAPSPHLLTLPQEILMQIITYSLQQSPPTELVTILLRNHFLIDQPNTNTLTLCPCLTAPEDNSHNSYGPDPCCRPNTAVWASSSSRIYRPCPFLTQSYTKDLRRVYSRSTLGRGMVIGGTCRRLREAVWDVLKFVDRESDVMGGADLKLIVCHVDCLALFLHDTARFPPSTSRNRQGGGSIPSFHPGLLLRHITHVQMTYWVNWKGGGGMMMAQDISRRGNIELRRWFEDVDFVHNQTEICPWESRSLMEECDVGSHVTLSAFSVRWKVGGLRTGKLGMVRETEEEEVEEEVEGEGIAKDQEYQRYMNRREEAAEMDQLCAAMMNKRLRLARERKLRGEWGEKGRKRRRIRRGRQREDDRWAQGL